MAIQLMDFRAHDCSRQFAELPQTVLWHALHKHIKRLRGVKMTGFISDGITEAWIDFEFQGHFFTVNDQFGEYWFFVKDPACPDAILARIVEHCESLLMPGRRKRDHTTDNPPADFGNPINAWLEWWRRLFGTTKKRP